MVSQPKQSVVVLRWLARLGSMASVALLFLFLFGEEMDPSQLTTSDILALLFFPFGVAAGLAMGNAGRYGNCFQFIGILQGDIRNKRPFPGRHLVYAVCLARIDLSVLRAAQP